jgi:hypothetical protein
VTAFTPCSQLFVRRSCGDVEARQVAFRMAQYGKLHILKPSVVSSMPRSLVHKPCSESNYDIREGILWVLWWWYRSVILVIPDDALTLVASVVLIILICASCPPRCLTLTR